MNRRNFLQMCFGGAAAAGAGLAVVRATSQAPPYWVRLKNGSVYYSPSPSKATPKLWGVRPVGIDPNVIEFYELHLDEILPIPIKLSPVYEKYQENYIKRWAEMYRLFNGLPPYSYPMKVRWIKPQRYV